MRTAGVLVALVIAAIVATVLWMTMRGTEQLAALQEQRAATATELVTARADNERLSTELGSAQRRAQGAEREAQSLRTELAAAQERLAAATAPPPEPAAAPRDWRDALKAFPAYRPEGVADVLATVDWQVVADSMARMPALIADLATHLAEGRPMTELPAETIGSIQRYNGPLVTTAMTLSQKGVSGTDANGAFSHPGFVANAIAATLLAMEMPLDSDQSARLDALAGDYSAREAARVARYGDDAYAVERLVDESQLKREYFHEVYALLTPEQHAALRPEAVRGRTQLDIFCESIMWSGRAGPLVFEDRADLAADAGSWVISRAALPAAAHERTRSLVVEWVDRLPDDFLAWEADSLVAAGMLHVEHVTDSATRVLDLLRTLERELDLDDAGRAGLRAVPGSIVPYRRAAE